MDEGTDCKVWYEDEWWYCYCATYSFKEKEFEIEFLARDDDEAMAKVEAMKTSIEFVGQVIVKKVYHEFGLN